MEKEKLNALRKEWLKKHKIGVIIWAVLIIGILVLAILTENIVMMGMPAVFFIAAHMWRNNSMSAYVESHYDGSGKPIKKK